MPRYARPPKPGDQIILYKFLRADLVWRARTLCVCDAVLNYARGPPGAARSVCAQFVYPAGCIYFHKGVHYCRCN